MTVPFRQNILPNDKGGDVLAYKRVLRKRGYHDVKLSRTAGPKFEHAVRMVQHNHKLPVDGIIGKKTHAVLATGFDKWGVYLYEHTPIRHRNPYINPFHNNPNVQIGRIDMGVDYHGYGPINAIGDGYVQGIGGRGWPGGVFLHYRITNGPHAGRYVYIAEAIIPTVRAGQTIKAGQQICKFRWDAAPGMFPGIETGWGTSTTNLTWAAAMGNTGGAGHSYSPAGVAFARFLHALGAPVTYPGPGPEFPV